MKSKLYLLGLIVALLGILVLPVLAQDSGPGEGGIVITDNIGGDPQTFNGIISNDTVSSAVTGWLYPSIIGLDPASGAPAPSCNEVPGCAPGTLAESWSYDDSGLVLTINLRQDLAWNDGTPITAADYLYSVNAVRSGLTSSPRTSMFATLDDGTPAGGNIVSIEASDDYTVVVTFEAVDCGSFNDVNDVPAVPSHIFSQIFGEEYGLMDEDPRYIPTTSFGTFKDVEFSPDQQVSLIADQTYPDTRLGFVAPEEWILRRVADTTVGYELFLAGEITYTGIPAERQNEIRGNTDFQTFEFSQNGFQYMGFNLADPANPQNGLDEEGNPIDQGNHPIFGDVRVRQAIAQAVDVDAMIQGILDGNGTKLVTHTIPTSWTYDPDLTGYSFDQEAALALLAEAGWVDDDSNPSTPLICDGCMYAEAGSPLAFTLQTNAGNLARERIGQTIQSQLAEIGIQVNFEAIDFGVLVQTLTGQQFDAIIIGWSLGLPVDPDLSWAYTPEGDIVGAGFAFTSYNNEEFNQLMEEGKTVPGCAVEDRQPVYQRALEILSVDLPYLYLYAGNVMYAAQGDVANFDPYPNFQVWNVDAWDASN